MQIGEKKNIVTSEKIHIFYLFEKDYWVLCRSFEDCPDLYKGIELPKKFKYHFRSHKYNNFLF